jgi:hypothetical protein
VSLLGFTSLMFFAVTGITLNHPTWFGADTQRTTTLEGHLEPRWVRPPESSPGIESTVPAATSEDVDPERFVDKFSVVEHLRGQHGLRGTVSEFRVDEFECLVLFKGPGYSADVVISRDTGRYSITKTVMGTVAIINDLHKGRDSGWVWSVVIDLTALLMVFVSVTGLVLIFYLKRRRWSGVVTAVVGTVLLSLIYVWWVP